MTQASPRIATLDFIRGVAVMGILAANLPAFGLPEAAYFSPLSWGGRGPADIAVWFATFVLVEGKMRGLFTLLFGASMLLVIDRAAAQGRNPVQVHFARMTVLFAIGCAHLYLVWWGDILAHYALVGGIAYVFARLETRWLVALGVAFLALEMLQDAAAMLALLTASARDTPAHVETWQAFAGIFGEPSRAQVAAEIVALGGPWDAGVAWRWRHATDPFTALPLIGIQTLGTMLFGMAAWRSGFLAGAWPRARYRRWAWVCLGTALPVYAALGIATLAHDFDQRWVFLGSVMASAPFRTIAAIGYAALLVLAYDPAGRVSRRIAAAGRAAFTNYLGTSLVMLTIFSGAGLALFGKLTRAELYLLAPPIWAIMLLWSAPWLARYRFGPLEWVWRSLARGSVQRMRRECEPYAKTLAS